MKGVDSTKVSPRIAKVLKNVKMKNVELQWLEHLWNHENMFETGVVRVNEVLIIASGQEA